jgi:hypothetical protein
MIDPVDEEESWRSLGIMIDLLLMKKKRVGDHLVIMITAEGTRPRFSRVFA